MREINLLPDSFKVKGSAVKLGKTLNKVATVVFVTLLMSVIVSVGTFFLFSRKLSDVTSEQNQLKTQIKALEETEQRLVLVKDRLEKVGEVYAKDTSSEEVITFESLIASIGGQVTLDTANLLTGSISISFTAENTSVLNGVIDNIIGSGLFESIELTSFTYAPEKGYEVELLMIGGSL